MIPVYLGKKGLWFTHCTYFQALLPPLNYHRHKRVRGMAKLHVARVGICKALHVMFARRCVPLLGPNRHVDRRGCIRQLLIWHGWHWQKSSFTALQSTNQQDAFGTKSARKKSGSKVLINVLISNGFQSCSNGFKYFKLFKSWQIILQTPLSFSRLLI